MDNTNPIPEKLKERFEDFKQYLSISRDEFVVAINSDFAVMDVDKRVKVENLLIAYDNMRNQLAAYQLAEGEKWIDVKSNDEIPVGSWLFALYEDNGFLGIKSGYKSDKNAIAIGYSYTWDAPKIVAYCPLPIYTLPTPPVK